MKVALLALPDTVRHSAHFELEASTHIKSSLHGTAACLPRGLTRSSEEEFRDNDNGELLAVFQYVAYEAVEEKEDVVEPQQAPRATRLQLST
jgi:hypothetical protein